MKASSRVAILVSCAMLATAARADDRTHWFRDIVVEKNETVEDVVCIGCGVQIKGATSDVVAFWGGVDVDGQPSGDVVVIGGGVRVRPGAKVDGDVVTFGGPVIMEPGGSSTGEVEAYPYCHFPGQRQIFWQGFVGLTGFSLLVAMLAYALVRRRRVENMTATLKVRPWMSLLFGLVFLAICLGLYCLPWLSVHLYNTWGYVYIATTILVAIPYAMGFIGVCSLLGSSVPISGNRFAPGTLKAALCGAVLVALGLLIPLAGILLWALLLMWATGVACLSRFGARAPLSVVPTGE